VQGSGVGSGQGGGRRRDREHSGKEKGKGKEIGTRKGKETGKEIVTRKGKGIVTEIVTETELVEVAAPNIPPPPPPSEDGSAELDIESTYVPMNPTNSDAAVFKIIEKPNKLLVLICWYRKWHRNFNGCYNASRLSARNTFSEPSTKCTKIV
jgi:hypothetical protein